ncbi:MAG: hypothetical protein HQL15_06665, partial [Candidatus Omnitrophica bacterium]|nr:hypothetical protein [Candidatus Omnitrophota bacterium]
MNLNLSKIQIQKYVFTAAQEQSISVLLLPYAELSTNIEQELQNNPLLEADLASDSLQEIQIEDLKRLKALANLPFEKSFNTNTEEDSDYESPGVAMMMTLEDHLFQQLFWEITDPFKRKIGEFIIGNLDKDGYLTLEC